MLFQIYLPGLWQQRDRVGASEREKRLTHHAQVVASVSPARRKRERRMRNVKTTGYVATAISIAELKYLQLISVWLTIEYVPGLVYKTVYYNTDCPGTSYQSIK